MALAQQVKPDVILMDIRMPGMDGIEAARVITIDLDEYVFAALRAGVSGFLLKDTPPGDLLAAIQVVASGDAPLALPHPQADRRVRPQPAHVPAASGVDLSEVTEREREVLTLMGSGCPTTR